MSFAVRKRYLRILVPVILALVLLGVLLLLLGGRGAVYRFRSPVSWETLRLNGLEGSYVSVPADKLASQTYAFYGYQDENEETIIEERFCYLVVEGKYLSVHVTEADVEELGKYEKGEEMVANGSIGSMLELKFADLAGTVVPGGEKDTRALMERWIGGQNIDGQTLKDKVTGADLSGYAGAEEGDYTAYFRDSILPYRMTIGYWGSRSQAAATFLAVLACVCFLLALLLLASIFLGVWERPYRQALCRWGKKPLRQDFAKARRFGRNKNFVLGENYLWWLRSFGSRVMPLEELLWAYPRSRRLEGGKKSWSLGLRSEDQEWSVRLGMLSTVQQAIEALEATGHPLALGFDKEKQKLFEKDLTAFKAKVRNGTMQ